MVPHIGPGASRRKDLDRVINALLLVVHLFVCFTLILFVLLHAGRGGGLSDMFGGAAGLPWSRRISTVSR